MSYYADTGFLLSLHLRESTSQAATSRMSHIHDPLPVTRLVAIEFRNALRLGVFRQKFTEAERAAVWSAFSQDMAAALLERVEEDVVAVFAEAESLCDQFTVTTGVRTLDLLHVASARVLGRTHFLSFDRRQRELAIAAGLNVFP